MLKNERTPAISKSLDHIISPYQSPRNFRGNFWLKMKSLIYKTISCQDRKFLKRNVMNQDRDRDQEKADADNHSDQLNPNNDAYWQSRGEDERPDDWEEQSKDK